MDKNYEDLIEKTARMLANKHIRNKLNIERPHMEEAPYEEAVRVYVNNNWGQWKYLAIDCMRETSKAMIGKPNNLEECLKKIYE